jgi:hypothetical protein
VNEGVPRIDVILGRCDDMRAEVYVRATGLPPDAGATIAGTLQGPEARGAVTLPATAALVDLGPGPDGAAAVARAILTEPSYWTPELPSRYRLRAVVTSPGATLGACDRLVGLRRLGVRGRSFWLEGRRWVPRAVGCTEASIDIPMLRGQLAAAAVVDPAESLCVAADERGLGIVARCTTDPVAACARWREHPSVMLAVVPSASAQTAAVIERVGRVKGTMLVGIEVDGLQPPPAVPRGIDFLVVALPEAHLPHAAWRAGPPLPLIAARPHPGPPAERRSACDRLQAELAAWRDGGQAAPWDWAGYLVERQT